MTAFAVWAVLRPDWLKDRWAARYGVALKNCFMGPDMRANLLHVFACSANPLRWRTRLENFHRFEHHILALGLPLTTVECSYGRHDWDLPDRPGVTRVRVRARDVLWRKENLLRLAAQHTPDWEYAATIDGDIHIVDPDWPICTLHTLQLHKIVQITSELVFLGPNGQHIGKTSSIMRLYLAALVEDCLTSPSSIYDAHPPATLVLKQHGYPGRAWAYRREAWDAIGGVMDKCIAGAADHHMAQALLELRQPGEPRGLSPGYDHTIRAKSIVRDASRTKRSRIANHCRASFDKALSSSRNNFGGKLGG